MCRVRAYSHTHTRTHTTQSLIPYNYFSIADRFKSYFLFLEDYGWEGALQYLSEVFMVQ